MAIKVDENVRLRPVAGGRPREIDILLRSSVAGYPIQIAIECKNECQTVGVGEIDAFIAKLQHVGLPVQTSIFVSSVGFTRGARERARVAGMRLLVLTGLTDDRLRVALMDAFQTVLYLLPVTGEWRFTNDVDAVDSSADLSCFYDESGKLVGAAGDLVWRAWHEGRLPTTLGKHNVRLQLPVGWRNIVRGRHSIPFSMEVDVFIYGFAVGFRGEARQHDLVNVETNEEEKRRVNAHFPATLQPVKLGPFRNEEELAAVATAHPAPIRLELRVRLPRIEMNRILWPPSEEFSRKAAEVFAAAHQQGKSLGDVDIATIETPSLAKLFEPVHMTDSLRQILNTPLGETVAG